MVDRARVQRFELRGIIGAGAVGTVYRAFDPQLEREVAIKVLARGPVPSELSTMRTLDLRNERTRAPDELLAEARVMAKLSHPNVLPIYEVGLDQGAVFLVMELVDGANLRTWLARPRTVAAIRQVFAQAARGVAAAHAAGIIHRDLKPDNLLIGTDGRVRVADFGISQLARQRGEVMRTVGEAGTPQYMAPELWRGEPATTRSDVYAFSLTLCEALLGERVTDAQGLLALRTRIDRRLATMIAAGLAEDPRARPSIGQVAAALDPATTRRTRLLVGGAGGAAAVLGGVALVLTRAPDAFPCAATSADLATRWTPTQRAALVGKLAKEPDAVQQLIGALDAEVARIATTRSATCKATPDADGGGERNVRARLACLDRRGYHLGAIVTRALVVERPRATLVADLVANLPDAEDCRHAEAVPSGGAAEVAALYEQFRAVFDLRAGERAKALEELEQIARARGELELAARAALERGLMTTSDPVQARALLERSHQDAVAAGARDIAARARVGQATLAMSVGDRGAAAPLVEQAGQYVENSALGVAVRTKVLLELASLALENDEPAKALEYARRARADIAASGRPLARLELFLRIKEVAALFLLDRPSLELARENVEVARRVVGDKSYHYAVARRALSESLQNAGFYAESLAVLESVVALSNREGVEGALSPDEPFAIGARSMLAERRIGSNDAQGGYDEIVALLAKVEAHPKLRSRRPRYLLTRAHAEARLGRVEDALHTAQESLELVLAKGLDAVGTRHARRVIAGYATELRQYDEAARQLAAIEASEERTPLAQRDVGARLLISSRLAFARGKAEEAEALATTAIAAIREKQRPGDLPWMADGHLGVALAGQERWREALVALDRSAAQARRVPGTAEVIAYFDIAWARAAWAVGRRAEARTRLHEVRAVLDNYPGERLSRALAAEVASMIDGPGRVKRGRRAKRA